MNHFPNCIYPQKIVLLKCEQCGKEEIINTERECLKDDVIEAANFLRNDCRNGNVLARGLGALWQALDALEAEEKK